MQLSAKVIYVGKTPVVPVLAKVSKSRLQQAVDTFQTAIARVNRLNSEGWPIGLEDRLAKSQYHYLSIFRKRRVHFDPPGITFVATPRKEYTSRPPTELAAYRLWQAGRDLTLPGLLAIAQVSVATRDIRKMRSCTTVYNSGHIIEYLDYEEIGTRLERVMLDYSRSYQGDAAEVILSAIGLYFDLLIIHPFADGNGRIARLLLQGHLHNNLMLMKPTLPVGPFIKANVAQYMKTLFHWYFHNDAEPLLMFLARAAEITSIAVERIARAP